MRSLPLLLVAILATIPIIATAGPPPWFPTIEAQSPPIDIQVPTTQVDNEPLPDPAPNLSSTVSDDLRELADQVRDNAATIADLADAQRERATKLTEQPPSTWSEPLDSLSDRVSKLEQNDARQDQTLATSAATIEKLAKAQRAVASLAELRNCNCEGCFSEAQIRAFAKEEAEKVVEIRLQLKTKAGPKDQAVALRADSRYVRLPGYAGTFRVSGNETITHVNGIPINRQPAMRSGSGPIVNATAGPYQLYTPPTPRGQPLDIIVTDSRMLPASPPPPQTFFQGFEFPQRSSRCRMVNGALQCN